jgi:hypothetical protein
VHGFLSFFGALNIQGQSFVVEDISSLLKALVGLKE